MDKAWIWCIIILLIPIVIIHLYRIYIKVSKYISSPINYTGDYWQNQAKERQTETNKTIIKKRVLGRKHPPCAAFFSKVNGEEKQIDGPYEEQWLTLTEKWNWKIRRRKDEQV